jgi:organic radical activating enzyme
MRNLILLPCVALLAGAVPAASAPPAVANQIASSDGQQAVTLSGGAPTQATAAKKICKQLPTTGSRLPKRTCLTANEWRQVDDDVTR